MTQLPEMGSQWEPLLRMLVALLLGAAVGWEREMQRQPAGFRTHALVGLGSAIFTVVSAFAFPGPLSDPTRIAAQIVTGVGFLGRRHPALPRQRPRPDHGRLVMGGGGGRHGGRCRPLRRGGRRSGPGDRDAGAVRLGRGLCKAKAATARQGWRARSRKTTKDPEDLS